MPEKGSVVLATAGRDAGRLFVLLESSDGEYLLADGRTRRLSHPKRQEPPPCADDSPAADPAAVRC